MERGDSVTGVQVFQCREYSLGQYGISGPLKNSGPAGAGKSHPKVGRLKAGARSDDFHPTRWFEVPPFTLEATPCALAPSAAGAH